MNRSDIAYLCGPEATPERRPKNATISIVVPAYNEAGCVEELGRRLQNVFKLRSDLAFEVIIVENGSSDGTIEKLLRLHSQDSRFKIVQLSRNFGCDNGMSAGLEFITGDACVLMTADLQDPPEMILDFVSLWEDGFDNVFGVVSSRRSSGIIRIFNSRAYYKLINWVSAQPVPSNASDFRIIDRVVYETVRNMPERSRFLRSMISWTGFRSAGIPFDRPKRFAGKSKAYTFGVLNNAVNSLLQSSQIIIRAIPIFGFLIFSGSLLAEIVLIFRWRVFGVPFDGFGSLVSIGLMSFGLVTLFLGVIGQYVYLIFEQVRARPNFVVRRVFAEND